MSKQKSTHNRGKKKKAHKRHAVKVPTGRPVLRPRGLCPCKGGCCRAAGSKCACGCHGRHHGTGPKRNPPASKPRIFPFARPIQIVYRRPDGKRFFHDFGPGAQILAPSGGGGYLVIRGVQLNRFMEG